MQMCIRDSYSSDAFKPDETAPVITASVVDIEDSYKQKLVITATDDSGETPEVRYVRGDYTKSYLDVYKRQPYGRMLGNISCNIPLKSQYSGKAISICLKEQYDFAGFNIEEILLGTGSEIRFYYAKANAGVLACALLMCILSAAMFTLY